MKLRDIAYDPKASIEGVWITYPGSDIEVLTGRMFTPEMVEWVDKMRREAADPVTSQVSDSDLNEITFQASLRFVCLGWRNVQDEDGNDIEFSEEVATEFFRERDKEYGHFYSWWLTVAQRRELFLVKTIEAQAKKLEASSNGNVGGEGTSTSSAPGTRKAKPPVLSETSPSSRGRSR